MKEHTITKLRELLEAKKDIQEMITGAFWLGGRAREAGRLLNVATGSNKGSGLTGRTYLAARKELGFDDIYTKLESLIKAYANKYIALVRQPDVTDEDIIKFRIDGTNNLYRELSAWSTTTSKDYQGLRGFSANLIAEEQAVLRIARGAGLPEHEARFLADDLVRAVAGGRAKKPTMRESIATRTSLVEADERFRSAMRKAAKEQDVQSYHRIMAKLRGPSSEIVNRWDDLEALNYKARRGMSRSEARKFVKSALDQGFAVVMRSGDFHNQRNIIDIFTDMRTSWYPLLGSNIWGRTFQVRDVLDVVNRVYQGVKDLRDAGHYGIYTPPYRDTEGVIHMIHTPYRAAEREDFIRGIPQFAAVPFSVLPQNIKDRMAIEGA